jgi:uncharacterized RDD family membrane protein YckC
VRRAWSQRRLPARGADRLLVAALLAWALFDVPWWWRPPGHGGSALAILSVLGLAAAQSVAVFVAAKAAGRGAGTGRGIAGGEMRDAP